jgi:hypothetical protein
MDSISGRGKRKIYSTVRTRSEDVDKNRHKKASQMCVYPEDNGHPNRRVELEYYMLVLSAFLTWHQNSTIDNIFIEGFLGLRCVNVIMVNLNRGNIIVCNLMLKERAIGIEEG